MSRFNDDARTWSDNGIVYTERNWNRPSDYMPIDYYTPQTTPWDYYGNKHVGEIVGVLKAARIPTHVIILDRKRLNPHGSGPNGRVRFGDDMMASVYQVLVPQYQMEAAAQAIAAFKEEVRLWINGDGPKPKHI